MLCISQTSKISIKWFGASFVQINTFRPQNQGNMQRHRVLLSCLFETFKEDSNYAFAPRRLLLFIIQMSVQQQQQQITLKYLFTITPLEIRSNSKLKANTAKAVLIKLGNKTAKCTQMGTPLLLQIDVLYSCTLRMYCPIKGIIKIYDVSEDGTEIISCVGGFQIDQLLNQGKNSVVIEKQLGTSKLKMDINILNKTDKRPEQRAPIVSRHSAKDISSSRQKYLLTKKSPSQRINQVPTEKLGNLPQRPSVPNIPSALKPSNSSSQVSQASESRQRQGLIGRGVELPFKNTSSNINKSLEKINQALNFKQRLEDTPSIRANQVLNKAELQTLRQQLADEKRRTALAEQRLSKANGKASTYRGIINGLQNDAKSTVEVFSKLLGELQIKQGKVQIEVDEIQHTVALKYREQQVDRTLKELIEYATRRVRDYQVPTLQAESEYQRGGAQVEQLKKQVSILKKLTMQKDKKIFSLQKSQEGMESTIQHLKETNKHLSEQNTYLREKNDQIELTLYHKENSLDSLRKQLDKHTLEVTELENRLYNTGLQNEQLRQEVDNCNQIIEQYRQKYGDLKNVKNRAIQMEIKECIRWIDQQNRDLEMSEMQETMQSELKEGEHKEEHSREELSSVIRNLQIEKVPVEQMSIIRDQLVRILRKIDSLMAK